VVIGAGLVLALLTGGWWAHEASKPKVRVLLFGKEGSREVLTSRSTVAGVLRQEGIPFGPRDLVAPPLDAPVTGGMEIDLGLVERRVKVEKRKVAHKVLTQYTETLNVGEIIDLEAGKDGLAEQEVETYLLNGEEAFEKVLSSKVLEPVKNSRVVEGTGFRQKLYPLTHRARARKALEMEATAYYPGAEDTWPYSSGIAASGLKAGYGMAAVDPKVIPLRTKVYVEGYGFAIAGDKGGAIKGRKIDLCFDTYEEAVRYGRKKVTVHILR
jgi:3D (Asp-Asp-Asp) domain-containing protein